jgi:hypothetical protein
MVKIILNKAISFQLFSPHTPARRLIPLLTSYFPLLAQRPLWGYFPIPNSQFVIKQFPPEASSHQLKASYRPDGASHFLGVIFFYKQFVPLGLKNYPAQRW